jgi:hypothetical protein
MSLAAAGQPGFIAAFTARVAAVVAAEHAGDPHGELVVWLQMALRREASVGELYGVANLEQRIAQVSAPAPIVALVRATIANIWAQERAHAAYLEAMLAAVARPPTLRRRLSARLDALLGALEGQVLSGRTSPSNLQRAKAAVMLAVGRRVQDVPEFVSALSALSFREFCLLNAELEVTAVHGYQRILALLDRLAGSPGLVDTTLAVDVARMIDDERYHNETFVAVARWFAGGELSPERCVDELARLRAAIYRRG